MTKYKGVAALLAKRHDRLALKYADSTDDEGTKKFYRHNNAATRFKRLSQGKKPFGGEGMTNEETDTNHVRGIINNLYDGNLDAMQTSFASAMQDKIGDALADRKISVAATIFAEPKQE